MKLPVKYLRRLIKVSDTCLFSKENDVFLFHLFRPSWHIVNIANNVLQRVFEAAAHNNQPPAYI